MQGECFYEELSLYIRKKTKRKRIEKKMNISVSLGDLILVKLVSSNTLNGNLTFEYLSLASLYKSPSTIIFNGTTLKYVDGKWKLNSYFDVGDYVNPNWSEVYNRSFFAKGKYKAVKKNYKKIYCRGKNLILASRINYYDSILGEESFSAKYLRKLRGTNTLYKLDPKRQVLSCD